MSAECHECGADLNYDLSCTVCDLRVRLVKAEGERDDERVGRLKAEDERETLRARLAGVEAEKDVIRSDAFDLVRDAELARNAAQAECERLRKELDRALSPLGQGDNT